MSPEPSTSPLGQSRQPTREQYDQLREALDFIEACTRNQRRGLNAAETRIIHAVANDRVVHQVAKDAFPKVVPS